MKQCPLPIRLSPTPTTCRMGRHTARKASRVGIDVLQRNHLPFPGSLPEFQRVFPDDAACAAYLEKARWSDGFVCPQCGAVGDPFRFASRRGVMRCRACRCDTSLTAGTVMERTHTPLSVWFWAAYLVSQRHARQRMTPRRPNRQGRTNLAYPVVSHTYYM